ncbi:MAG: DegV family EDD domain-containing protein, partial [Erysipelotrichaceae bacterium]|nr:DegV family EDD domain-containing protein [Erysipelotrichaceae bacterium]
TGIAGELSATLNVAKLAAEEFPEGRIHVIDSKSLSSGIALILLSAARLIEQGKSVEEVVQEIKDVRERVRAQFVVEKLDFLYRGGRLSSAKYVLGKAVRARPYLVVAQGRIEAVGLPKGKMKRALKLQLESFKRHYEEGIDESMIFVTSAGNRGDEYADYYVKKLVEYIPRENIVVQKAGSVISTHCGEGTVGILYIRDVKNDFNN